MSLRAGFIALLAAFMPFSATQAAGQATARYGMNSQVGRTFIHDGVALYYEQYGSGRPLLIIHGNGGSIRTLSAQIDYFRRSYKVIVMDSRDHGRSADSPDALTFESMTDDLAALLEHLHTGPANVLGWSDGGIEALLLGIRHPDKVKMIAAMAANLDPGGIHPDFLAAAEEQGRTTKTGKSMIQPVTRETRVDRLDRDEPHIKPEALQAIRAPTLVMAGDHDLVRDEHTVMIYHHIPNSQLAILPNATHMIPFDDPALFNATVDRFFSTEFVRRNRVADLMKSVRKMSQSIAAEQ